MTGRMDSVMAQILMRVILHIQLNQAEDAAEVFMELMSPTIYTDIVKLKDELRTLTLNYVNAHQGSSRYNYGRLVLEATAIGLRNYCKVPNGLALWAKGFSATEGTARWICPEISYGEVVEAYEIPILKSILGKRFNFRANASLVAETAEMIATFPRRFNKVLETMAENKWRMTVQVQTDPVTRNTLNQIANRLALSLIAFAVIMATVDCRQHSGRNVSRHGENDDRQHRVGCLVRFDFVPLLAAVPHPEAAVVVLTGKASVER
ncbi:hypothetical protein LR69_02044 [Geobacillus sp. BCO2]|nr:hypothetical protein LR69_02044 [Geobacillus sp. BCO2]